MEKILTKVDFFQRFFPGLIAKYEVAGPTNKGGATSSYAFTTFERINRTIDLEIDYKSNMLSPKRFFFPDNELLYKYTIHGSHVLLEDSRGVWPAEKVIFALRPCDITAILRLDRVLVQNAFVDQHYWDRRRKSIIIGLTCNEAKPSCFCNSLGSGPDIEDGYDLLVTEIEDSYFFKSGTNLGESLISCDYFRDATDHERDLRRIRLQTLDRQLPETLDMARITSVIADKYNDELWDQFSTKCFACGACNMVCPTCRCFTINDKTSIDGRTGTRVMLWDPCHFPRFAQTAGNFNSREAKDSRFKHRIYDKFYYSWARYGTMSCTGCGRCLEFCPSHIDIRVALRSL